MALYSSLYLAVAAAFFGTNHHMFAHASPLELEARQSSLPTGWVPFGCYSDTPASRTLRVASFTDVTGMTIEACIAFCAPSGFLFAGVEFSRECYCDNVIESPAVPIASSSCNMPCTGNSGEICGGSNAISIFQNTLGPKIKQTAGTYQYVGCYQDGVNGAPRSLQHQLSVTGGNSAEKCTAACKAAGFVLAGLEFGQECWCDSYFPSPVLVPDTDCNMVCTGDNTELCGAGNRLAIYEDNSAAPLAFTACLTCAQLRRGTTSGTATFNITALPQTTAAVPIATPTSLAPIQMVVVELAATAGQSTRQELAALGTLGFGSGTTYSMPCNDGTQPTLFTLASRSPQIPNQGFAVAPTLGQPLQFEEVATGPSFTDDQSYCAAPNTVTSKSTFIGPPLLSRTTLINQWGLCPLGTFAQPTANVVTWAFEHASVLCIPALLELSLT